MPNVKDVLKELNPELFGMRQPSKEHEMFLVGRKETKNKDGKNTFEIIYLLKSKPNAAAAAAGIKVQDFIHAAFKPIGTITTASDGRRSFQGPKKARTGVVFLNTQPDLYNFIKEGLELGEGDDLGYKKAGFDAQKRPMIKMRDTVFGLKVGFNTPLYNPHSMSAEGKLEPLVATTFDPKTGKYAKKKVVIGYYEFFADDDDLDKLLEVCARHYSKHIEPHLTEKVTTVTEKGGEKNIKVVEEKMTPPANEAEIIFDADGNSVDENGDVLETAEDLAARGIVAP